LACSSGLSSGPSVELRPSVVVMVRIVGTGPPTHVGTPY
jgi:hypothetical protein